MVAQSVDDLHSANNRLGASTSLTERGATIAGFGYTPNWHDMLTGSTADGRAFPGNLNMTCNNWTSSQFGNAMLGHVDRRGGADNEFQRSWNSSHQSRSCSQDDLRATGGNGLFYASRPTDRPQCGRRQGSPLSAILFRALDGLAAAAANQAAAQPAAPACGGATIATGEVARVIDGKTFVLSDGREARLAAIEAPPVSAADPNEEHAAVGQAAKTALEGLLIHHSVVLKSAGGGPDRYGRLIAQAFTPGPTQEIWVQSEILTKGYALVAPGGDISTCLSFLRGVERKARDGMLGLWGDPYFVMKEAQYPDDVMTELGRFALVGGKVISVGERGGGVSELGGAGRRFTVTIPKRNQRAFVTQGSIRKSWPAGASRCVAGSRRGR